MRRVALAVSVGLTLAGCGGAADDGTEASASQISCIDSGLAGAWTSLASVSAHDLVAFGTVITEDLFEAPGEYRDGPGEGTTFARELTFELDNVFAGDRRSGERIALHDVWGVNVRDGERRNMSPHCSPVEVGDRVMVATNESTTAHVRFPGEPRDGLYFLPTRKVLYLEDGNVVDTGRTDPVFSNVERLSEAELADRLRDLMGS